MEKLLTYILFFSLLIFCGCERKAHTPPPVESLSLTTRFFDSIAKRDSATAVRQGKTIYQLDKSRNYISTLISIQQSNNAIAQAQKLLDAGKTKEALETVNNALKLYPDNDVLRKSKVKLEQLVNADRLLIAMARARSSAAMCDARETAETGLSENRTHALIAYLAEYEKLEKSIAMREEKNTQESLEAATAAAEKAKKEDALREAEYIKFMQEMASISEKGDQMRQDAGGVPFEEPAKEETQKND